MNNVKKNFSIRDLENLSGIKAHTIRIWEKRYNLLAPERTATNIRTYSLSSLQKLLNVTLLYNNGYKISKISRIPEGNIPLMVREIVAKNSVKNHAINAFKLSMINFDQSLFMSTYNSILVDKSFRDVFKEVFIPLLNEIGLLWQTDTISPAHEHFITSLIKQKILINTEKLQHLEPVKKDKIFVPFLPENEIHEIGLLYLNYEIVLRGYKSIYLGQTVPLDTLKDVMKYFDNLCFLSYFTVTPTKEKIEKYMLEFTDLIKEYGAADVWLLGYQTKHLDSGNLPDFVKTFNSIDQVVEQL
ncbi:MerR family transcriptional regulator [Maribacter algarum]|uniref:MerR family transcriptional regulator n=1 Tax=Maribacter algarum (ex Zhang et al. 2020) TaxID=2578118 RepID=A0A5S3PGZ4_9FLAO|nr:MerR family transcriptional regulator [Maribacter algarum]TMM53377.1 MerR family transcriptional regulator [Maribacter algarum]